MLIDSATFIKGINVTLYVKTKTGVNRLGEDEYSLEPVIVSNVLVQPVSGDEALEELNLTGRKLLYNLGIPKGDTHDWTNVRVDFFGKSFQTFGEPIEGIEGMIPLEWNRKVKVERYGERENNAE